MLSLVLFISGQRGLSVLETLSLRDDVYIKAIVVPGNSKFNDYDNVKYRQFTFIKETNVNQQAFISQLKLMSPDLFYVAGFPTIFRTDLLLVPNMYVVNLHGGKLPEYRGGSPLNWQIINDEKKVGVSLIKMDGGIDTGDIILSSEFALSDIDDINTVHEEANKSFVALTNEYFDRLAQSTIEFREQRHENAVYWLQRSEIDGRIEWTHMTARQIFNLARALKPPYPRAYTFLDGKRIYLNEVVIPKDDVRGKPGKIVYLNGVGPYVVCKDRAVLVQAESRLPNGGYLI